MQHYINKSAMSIFLLFFYVHFQLALFYLVRLRLLGTEDFRAAHPGRFSLDPSSRTFSSFLFVQNLQRLGCITRV